MTALYLVGDLTRMGTLAGHIATIIRQRHPGHAVQTRSAPLSRRWGAAAVAIAPARQRYWNSATRATRRASISKTT
ncbi:MULTISPECIES: hypothetical protein [unclassified Nocardia]|uniref:hypothetical protein n=1 Tax=unclassified Nocardia TaxID=2637762 RepID=UPI0034126109